MWNMSKNTTSSKKFFNWNTIYGKDGEHATPYQTRITLGRLRLHIFHRGDADPDCHNHPWDFWTFPLTSYVEEVAEEQPRKLDGDGQQIDHIHYVLRRQIVRSFMLHYRPAGHTHRVLGRYAPNEPRGWEVLTDPFDPPRPQFDGRAVVTLVWRSKEHGRGWGFLKERLGRWCRVSHKDYIWGGGKDAPCGD